MATSEHAIIMKEVYQAIKDNGFKNRHELNEFLLKDAKKYEKHLEWVSMDTIYFTEKAVDMMIDRSQKILNGDYSWRKSSESKRPTMPINYGVEPYPLTQDIKMIQKRYKPRIKIKNKKSKSKENGGYER